MEAIGPGAQTSRLDDAVPVKRVLGRKASPARLMRFPKIQRPNGLPVKTGARANKAHAMAESCLLLRYYPNPAKTRHGS